MSRYSVRYSHSNCHPETCSHISDWQLCDGPFCIEYFENESDAKETADCLNAMEAEPPQ